MRQTRQLLTTILALFAMACSPIVTTHAFGPGVEIFGKCIKDGKESVIEISILPTKEGTPWDFEFVGSSPEGLRTWVDNKVTKLRWKLGQDHIKKSGVGPYGVKLSSDGKIIYATVRVKTVEEQANENFLQILFHL